MNEVIVFPDVEALLVRTLAPLLGVPVTTKVPNPLPAAFVRVSRLGGLRPDLITDSATVVFEAWAATDPDAAELAERARAYTVALAGDSYDGDFVRRVRETVGLTSFPNPETGSPRYQFTLVIDTRGRAL